MNKRWLKLAAVPIALSLVAAACGSDDDSGSGSGDSTPADGTAAEGGTEDFGGATVTLTGPERDDPSIAAINDTLNAWGETVNLKVEYTGDADWEANINTQVEGGNPPDISFFPQPGKLADFARDESVASADRRDERHRSTSTGPRTSRRTATSTACSTASRPRPTSSRSSGTSPPPSRRPATRSRPRSTSSPHSSTRWPQPVAPSRCASASSPARPRAGPSPTGSRRWCCARPAATSTTSG